MSTRMATGLSGLKNCETAAASALKEAQEKLGGTPPGLALVHASSSCDYQKVLELAKKTLGHVPLVGCSTAGHFTENRMGPGGIAVALISSNSMTFSTAMASGLRADPEGVVRTLAQSIPTVPEGRHLTAVLFADGLSGTGEELTIFASRLFERFAGCPVTLIGGFAGDDLHFRETRVFHETGHAPDAAAVCFITSERPFPTGVRHGHKPLSKSHTVTSARGNHLIEVDGLPAWEVWSRETGYALEKLKARYRIGSPEEFSALVLGNFELGLCTDGEDYKIRFPMAVNPDGSMVFTCSIPQGSVFRIMDGSETDSQVEASSRAAADALKAAEISGIGNSAGMMVFECGVRLALLQDDFIRAIEAYRRIVPGIPVIGWETYGEIRMNPGGYSGFHNTTTVVALVPED